MKAAPILWLDVLINLFAKSINYKYLHDIQAVITYARIKRLITFMRVYNLLSTKHLMGPLDVICKNTF